METVDHREEDCVTTTGGSIMNDHHDHDDLCNTGRMLPVGSEGCTCEKLWELREKGTDYAVALYSANVILKRFYPGCTPMDNLLGILIQLDHYIAGQSKWAAEKEGLEEKVREQRYMYDEYIKDRQAEFSKDQPV